VSRGAQKIVDYLVSLEDIDVNVQNDEGNTPLMLAITKGHQVMALGILEKALYRLDLKMTNRSGHDALYIARERGYDNIARIIKKTAEPAQLLADRVNHHGLLFSRQDVIRSPLSQGLRYQPAL
jgi:ankyrin repeat protein